MKIIYISGIDGCGKTTQSAKLIDNLQAKGLNAEYLWLRWEPSLRKTIKMFRNAKINSSASRMENGMEQENADESGWLKFKRNMMDNPLLRYLWLMYACCDYYRNYREKFKELQGGLIVLDRYVDDFIIDQAINLNIPPERMDLIKHNYFLTKFHIPNCRIIIDLPPHEGYKRKSDGTPLSYLQTREKYYMAMSGNNTLHLSGLESIDDLAEEIYNWVISLLEVER